MRDGVNLSANVYFPPGQKGPFPVLLNVTPYGKDSSRRTEVRSIIRYFASQGYAVVHVDVRGPGKFRRNVHSLLSGDRGRARYDRVGGNSALVDWQDSVPSGDFMAAAPRLYPLRLGSKSQKCAFVMCSPSIHPFHDCTAYTSGTFMPIMISWAMLLTGRTLKQEIPIEKSTGSL